MTNKELVLSLYPNAVCTMTFRGMDDFPRIPPIYYIKNGDTLISNSPEKAWREVGKNIKQGLLRKLEQ